MSERSINVARLNYHPPLGGKSQPWEVLGRHERHLSAILGVRPLMAVKVDDGSKVPPVAV